MQLFNEIYLIAPCPYGTRSTSRACLYCDVGTYQDETGQGDCKPCPRGLTTQTIGAMNITDCIEGIALLILKKPNKNCSRRHLNVLLFSLEENKA